jgi:hypothetical protein
MISVHPQMLAQLQERAARCTELEKLAAEVVAELETLVGRANGDDNGAFQVAADLVAEKLGVGK